MLDTAVGLHNKGVGIEGVGILAACYMLMAVQLGLDCKLSCHTTTRWYGALLRCCYRLHFQLPDLLTSTIAGLQTDRLMSKICPAKW